jgi:hypothetical protein
VEWIFKKLGSTSFVDAVVISIQLAKTVQTEQMEVARGVFDTRTECLGFTDGVYDFETRALVSGEAAQAYYVSKTVPYAHADLASVTDEDLAGPDAFFARIHGKTAMREYLITSFMTRRAVTTVKWCLCTTTVAEPTGSRRGSRW